MPDNDNGKKKGKGIEFDQDRCYELVKEGVPCDKIAEELGVDPTKFRRSLQSFVLRKMHQDKTYYHIEGLYKDPDNGYKDKPVKWSKERGITISPKRLPEEFYKDFKHGETTFKIDTQGSNLVVIPNP